MAKASDQSHVWATNSHEQNIYVAPSSAASHFSLFLLLRLWHSIENKHNERKKLYQIYNRTGFSGDTVVNNLPAKAGDTRDVGLIPESGSKSRKWQSSPVFLFGKFRGQRSLADYGPSGHKGSDTTDYACTHMDRIRNWDWRKGWGQNTSTLNKSRSARVSINCFSWVHCKIYLSNKWLLHWECWFLGSVLKPMTGLTGNKPTSISEEIVLLEQTDEFQ